MQTILPSTTTVICCGSLGTLTSLPDPVRNQAALPLRIADPESLDGDLDRRLGVRCLDEAVLPLGAHQRNPPLVKGAPR
jgi:hypothetical protein